MNQIEETATSCLSDWPDGPLSGYRSRSSFNWKRLKLITEGEDELVTKVAIWKAMEGEPLFHRQPWDEPSRAEQRRLNSLRFLKTKELKFMDADKFDTNPLLIAPCHKAINQYDTCLLIKGTSARDTFITSARLSGSESQQQFVTDAINYEAFGCLVITELAHGSDTKRFNTRATFDPVRQEFVFNTPEIEATKVWSGNAAHLATHGNVFAQLYSPDGVCHGLHTFFVPLRDQKTYEVYPGVTIGDMGPKMGLNGLDNGWIQFKNYRAPKSCLLNKYADVTPEGKYVAKASKKRRHGINLGTLSVGRIGIIGQACDSLQLATTIAIRYAAVRKQFGPTDEEEWPLLEYPTHQWRLFPYVAACYVIDHFQRSLYHNFLNFIGELHYGGGASDEMDALGAEIHSLSSAGKAVSGWMARDGVQEAREACGGHGYLKASRLGDLKNDLEPILTYEGDNNVLLPQASNFILKVYQEKLEGKSVDTSMATCEFLKYDSSLKDLQVDVSDIESLLQVFQRLASYLTRITDDALQSKLEANGGDNFRAKTQSNVYYMRSLAIVYYEVNAAKSFYEDVVKGAAASPEADVLRKMCHLYLLWSLEKQLVNLCHASDGQVTAQLIDQIRSKLLSLCAELKNEVVSLVDTYSPPDFVLNSVLGHSDGEIYEHLFEAMTQNEPTYATPPYQDEFGKTVATADVCASPQLKSKL